MKKLIIAMALVLGLAVGGRAWGENYTIVIAPNGNTCRHINIENEKGEVVEITTKDEVKEPQSDNDSEALKQIKVFFKKSKAQSLLNYTISTKVDIQKDEAWSAE
ncbi:MAG: hypothetical protein C4540_04605 [Candidatus Omnitrophota bacterium]|jgi:hypothetical protein|nr:MAG: hypothetical protein C4540_04605 [Candidatus Omnitrophota bacterium]